MEAHRAPVMNGALDAAVSFIIHPFGTSWTPDSTRFASTGPHPAILGAERLEGVERPSARRPPCRDCKVWFLIVWYLDCYFDGHYPRSQTK